MAAEPQPRKADYTVKNVETVLRGKDVLARIFTLAPGEVIPWHSHSKVTDHFFVLSGELTVETRGAGEHRTRAVGERCQITAGNAHQTSNRGTTDCRFLLLQGGDEYDWIKG
jgi:quercetin dioxygenase-like cupin family protein